MRKKRTITITAIGIMLTMVVMILIGAVIAGPMMSNVETPDYRIVETQDNIEIRKYEPMIVAEVQMDGERKEAITNGFRLLADYIFGNSTVKQKIAMTAPVQQQAADDSWKISFVMPSEYSMRTLPAPADNLITLKEIPSKHFIAIRFSGTNSDMNLKKHEDKLMQHIKANDLLVTGSPKYAFYNAPWTLPMMRRNEIMIEVDK